MLFMTHRDPIRTAKTNSGRGRRVQANSVARALVLIGDRWSLLIIGSAFQGVKRFDEWRKGIGIASNILSSRLQRLVKVGCFVKVPSDAGGHSVYRLTEMGAGLFATALMFWRFDRQWSQKRAFQPVALIHAACGESMVPQVICAHCRAPVFARDVSFVPGPGAAMEELPPPKSSRRSNVTFEDGPGIAMLFGDSVDYFGDRWTQMVLASFFLGDRRYEDIRARWHIATNILADRLRILVDNGMLQRRIYQTNPERSEYVLTPKGMDVYPAILALTQWGDRWLADKSGRPLILMHTKCGRELHPLVVCDHCGGAIDAHEVSFKSKS